MERYLEFKGIKSLPGVQALKEISFGQRVDVMCSANAPESQRSSKYLPRSLRRGRYYNFRKKQNFTALDAIKAGVSVIYQERQMIPAMSVMENIFAGALPKTSLALSTSRAEAGSAGNYLKFGLSIDPTTPVGRLSVAYQQMEIMKAYRRGSIL